MTTLPPSIVVPKLTPRERDVLSHLVQGGSNLFIANAIGISERTVKAYLHNLYLKFGIIAPHDKRVQLAVLFHRLQKGAICQISTETADLLSKSAGLRALSATA